jgi:purine nucleoside phosphorylase
MLLTKNAEDTFVRKPGPALCMASPFCCANLPDEVTNNFGTDQVVRIRREAYVATPRPLFETIAECGAK